MSFELSRKFKVDQDVNGTALTDFIKDRLTKSCKYKVASESPEHSHRSLLVKGYVKETVLTSVTKFDITFDIKMKNNEVRVLVSGNSGPDWVFWMFFLVGLFTGIFILIGIGLYLLQRNRPKDTCEGILNAMVTEYSSL